MSWPSTNWSKAWSVVLGGARIPRGFVHGKTDAKGTAVVDGQVDAANLFHTYLQAVGINSTPYKGRDASIYDGWCNAGCPTRADRRST